MKTILPILLIFFITADIYAQDTVRVSLQEFIEKGLERSGQVSYDHRSVEMAENRIYQAKASRILPSVNLSTNHGLIPGVQSETDLPSRQWYLDPNLENDFNDWAIFTRAEIDAVQPIFTWGAINKAIKAAELGAKAARNEFEAKKSGIELQLYELYYSYLLAVELGRILDDAQSTIDQVERQIRQMEEDGDPGLRERDVFEFEIQKSEFEIQKAEVQQSIMRIQRIWDYILADNRQIKYMPEEDFLDPIPFEVESFDYYQNRAMQQRPEMKGVEAGIEAMQHSVDALRAQNYPSLFIGLTASMAHTPNRPRQSNPFIINNTNFMNAGVGFGIRQNLNFVSIRNRINRERIEYNRVRDLQDALSDGIVLELNEAYQDAVLSEAKVKNLEDALRTTRQWVRQEQLNYDFGFGEVEDLVDSVVKELELRVELKQSIFEMNKRIARLYNVSGIPITHLSIN